MSSQLDRIERMLEELVLVSRTARVKEAESDFVAMAANIESLVAPGQRAIGSEFTSILESYKKKHCEYISSVMRHGADVMGSGDGKPFNTTVASRLAT